MNTVSEEGIAKINATSKLVLYLMTRLAADIPSSDGGDAGGEPADIPLSRGTGTDVWSHRQSDRTESHPFPPDVSGSAAQSNNRDAQYAYQPQVHEWSQLHLSEFLSRIDITPGPVKPIMYRLGESKP